VADEDDDRTMTGPEAMMWHLERDPWLAPSGGSLTLFDRPIDIDRFRRLMRHAVVHVPRLHQRVVDPTSPLGTPHWENDHELDLAWHVRQAGAPGRGTLPELLEWLTPWLQDPYDRTRPLWQYVVIDGVDGDRGAIATKLHHVVTDGKGAVRLAMAYTALTPDADDPPEVDLDAYLAALPHDHPGAARQVRDTVAGALRLPLGATRFVTGALANPGRLAATRHQLDELARTASDQLHGAGSTLWQPRSRRRCLEALSLRFDAVHDAAKALGGTVNDLFVAGAVEAAARYHAAVGSPLERLHISFVVATGGDAEGTHNAFTPVPVDVPAGAMTLAERFTSVRDVIHRRRAEVHGGGPMESVSAVANLLPTGIVAGIARSQAAHIDFATSNLPGYLGDTYVAGARTEHTYVFGPVAGTAFNLTAYSTAGNLDIGVQIDPSAVTDPRRLRSELEGAYAALIELGTPPPHAARRTGVRRSRQ
jgi:WS/DGAT/MGAT family acyltransferase